MVNPPPPETIPTRDEFPSPFMPTVYADGATSFTPGPQIVKFYLGRLEPHLRAENQQLIQPIVQVVMSNHGFLQMAAFFRNVTQNMLSQNIVTQEQIDAAEAIAGGKSATP